jgi:hypothetical protein
MIDWSTARTVHYPSWTLSANGGERCLPRSPRFNSSALSPQSKQPIPSPPQNAAAPAC